MFTRVLFGGLAGAAAAVPMAAPAPVQAAPAPMAQPRVDGLVGVLDPSTLESCTAYFGLSKANSTLMSFEVTDVSGLSPAPIIGAGITPVVTVTMADASVTQCVPDAGWTDGASFDTLLRDTNVGNLFARPSGTYYLVPGGGLGSRHLDNLQFNPIDAVQSIVIDLVADPAIASVVTVEWTPTFAYRNFTTSADARAAARAAVRAAIDPSLFTIFDEQVDASAQCMSFDGDLALMAALYALLPDDAQTTAVGVGAPNDLCIIMIMLAAHYDFAATVAHSPVPVRIAAAPPAPTTTAPSSASTSAPTATTTDAVGGSGGALPDTGSGSAPSPLLIGSLVAAGGALVLLARRRPV